MLQDTPISFLLGAGFSKPAGYPLASEINKLFLDLKEGDISITTGGTARFNGGKPGPNDWFMQKDERLFAERLLAHYCTHLVGSAAPFHYETFFDWYQDLKEGRTSDVKVQAIADNLGKDARTLLESFDSSFNQLLAQLLGKRFPEVHLGRGLPRSHARFLDLCELLGRQYVLHFHSLNHDLFFESLSSTDAIQGALADGFAELGSSYYGTLEREEDGGAGKGVFSYTVRVPRFVGKFDSRFNLYKLHGSVDHYIIRDRERETVKNKLGVGPGTLWKEVRGSEALKLKRPYVNDYPSYLSGTTFKTLQYDSTPYYKSVFKRFKSNLERSSVLIVIGYGFGDSEINKLVKKHFLEKRGSKIMIIDVCEPQLPEDFRKSAQFINGGVSSINPERLQSSIAIAP